MIFCIANKWLFLAVLSKEQKEPYRHRDKREKRERPRNTKILQQAFSILFALWF